PVLSFSRSEAVDPSCVLPKTLWNSVLLWRILQLLKQVPNRSAQHREVSPVPDLKSQTFIQGNGPFVVRSDVQERRLSPVPYAPHNLRHQRTGIAPAEMVRMRADR